MSETAYEVIRKRARASGQSIQGYMRGEVERMAAMPDRAELFDRIERHVAEHGIAVEAAEITADVHSARR